MPHTSRDTICQNDIERLRKRGEMETLAGGEEGVRLCARFPGRPAARDLAAWRATMQAWERDLSDQIRQFGAHTVEGSLSAAGQTVEFVVPVAHLDAAIRKLAEDDVEVRLVAERRIDPNY